MSEDHPLNAAAETDVENTVHGVAMTIDNALTLAHDTSKKVFVHPDNIAAIVEGAITVGTQLHLLSGTVLTVAEDVETVLAWLGW